MKYLDFQEESVESMPSRRSSVDSVKPRRGGARTRNETPPPAALSKSTKKTNGTTKDESKKESTKEAAKKGKEDADDPEDSIDLSAETSCRLCDKKDFRANTEALTKHYATMHYKVNLESEIKNETNCIVCKE